MTWKLEHLQREHTASAAGQNYEQNTQKHVQSKRKEQERGGCLLGCSGLETAPLRVKLTVMNNEENLKWQNGSRKWQISSKVRLGFK